MTRAKEFPRGIRPVDNIKRKDPTILIMAGGEGTRFAPLSTPEYPKQFHPIIKNRPLIYQTMERAKKLTGSKGYHNIYIATNFKYIDYIKDLFPNFPQSNLIIETEKKNTAPTLALASYIVFTRSPEAVLLALPCDHFVEDEDKFMIDIYSGLTLASRYDTIVTFGIIPEYPSTEYGYIQRNNNKIESGYMVERFVEKPSLEKAKQYLSNGLYYWNSGMFVWNMKTGCDAFVKYCPEMMDLMIETISFGDPQQYQVDDFFRKVEPISVDYAIMEKVKNTLVVPSSFGWSDLGGWESLRKLYDSRKVKIQDYIKDIMMEKTNASSI